MADFGQWLGEDRTPESAPRETETKLPNGVGIAVYPNKDEYHGKIENSERVGKGVHGGGKQVRERLPRARGCATEQIVAHESGWPRLRLYG